MSKEGVQATAAIIGFALNVGMMFWAIKLVEGGNLFWAAVTGVLALRWAGRDWAGRDDR